MASSRIFVKGLPPTLSEADLRKYFSQKDGEITDAKILPGRRIGYVGYKTPDDAEKAVKYFNKSFIRMSKISVEMARPVQDAKTYNESKSSVSRAEPRLDIIGSSTTQNLKRKRDAGRENEADPKLQEFLAVMKPKKKKDLRDAESVREEQEDLQSDGDTPMEAVAAGESDDEYENVPKKDLKHPKSLHQAKTMAVGSQDAAILAAGSELPDGGDEHKASAIEETAQDADGPSSGPVSDMDWARSRTSRLLGLLDDEEEEAENIRQAGQQPAESFGGEEEVIEKGQAKKSALSNASAAPHTISPPATDNEGDYAHSSVDESNEGAVRSTMRLFVRNLPYNLQDADLESEFAPYGNLEDVHVSIDKTTGAGKGFGFVQFSDPDSAERAMQEKDGQIFQGRLIQVLPAQAKRESNLDEFELAKLPWKTQQQIKRRQKAPSSQFNWNALYMNADAVVSSVAARLGLSKSEVLDPTSSDSAIKQAHAETHIIQETKMYFKKQGVDLDAFKKSQRGDLAILVKNIPYDCSPDELRQLFEEHGQLSRFLIPPSGTTAIVEFANSAQCKAAYRALAYRRVKNSMIFLEKAPKDIFKEPLQAIAATSTPQGVTRTAATELKQTAETGAVGSTTLFVRNLNFSTTSAKLTETFDALDGFLSARVKTRTDPKKPGQILSMGFGFLEFQSLPQARAALQTMDGYVLEGHKLQVRASHKGADAAEERRRADADKRAAAKHTKIIIKNLPFQATKKEVRALFGAYGQLRSVRVPQKADRTARGFAFADFVTPKEAENAVDALQHTHLLGRRLVLELAAEDAEDAEAEIERMQQKVGRQVNKVALQKLTSGGRKKFTTQVDDDDL